MVEIGLVDIVAGAILFGIGAANFVHYYDAKNKLNRMNSGTARNKARLELYLMNARGPLYKSLFYGEKRAYEEFLRRNR